MSPIRISSIIFEHHPTGLGIGHASPRLSWRFSSSASQTEPRNWVQESYEIEISRHNAPEKPENYTVQSKESILVPWPSHALQSRERAAVKVRAHGNAIDSNGNPTRESTEWSESAVVEAALLHKSDWSAKLTTSTITGSDKESVRPLIFRKAFSLPENAGHISKARLYITAHGIYKAYVNGTRIGNEEMAPGWTSYNHRLLYQTFDVAASLSQGGKQHVLGVSVAEGWFAGRLGWKSYRRIYGDKLAILAQLEVQFESGQSYKLQSDGSWKSGHHATTRSEIYDGEDCDTRLANHGWSSDADFNEEYLSPTQELDFPSAQLLASETPPVRVTEELAPKNIFLSKSGKTIVDFGQNLVGKVELRLPVGPEGQQVTLSHAEVMENSELGMRPLRTAKPIDNVILSQSQPATWTPQFTFHGFRYVQVDGWPLNNGVPDTSEIKALVLHSDMTRTGWFSCSNSLINQLHENVLWSIKGNFLSVPTDCPQRDERLGWTGDIQVFSPSANLLFNTNAFLGNWLADVSVEQLEESRKGVPGLVTPDILNDNTLGPQCAWHDVTVLTPWDLYTTSGDKELLRDQYASMKAWVDVGLPRGPNGLWDQNIWQLGDWLDPAAPPEEPGNGTTDGIFVADAYLVRVLETMAKVSAVLGEVKDATRYSQEAAHAKKTFQYEYVAPSGLLVCDTQTAHSLALTFGLLGGKSQIAKSAGRLNHLVYNAKFRIATGFVGTPLVSHALSDSGSYQMAYRMLLEKKCPSWLYPITMGATTIWERWDSMLPDGSINPGSMTSFNHYALGSVANWLHKNVGGISPLEPGWKTVKVRPVPGGDLTSATVKYEGPYGRIESSWHVGDDGTFHLKVTIPPNSHAVVILPDAWKMDTQSEEQGMEIGSGTYEYQCSYSPSDWPPKALLKRSQFGLDLADEGGREAI
ncbi:hypothetical protein K4F52_009955 [Lecanicillium sp. MT-2017a]|nr:hypothetical protein K4F52_009955 [Lecanicillium sp. MT-2017a]